VGGLVIRGGTVVAPDGIRPADLLVAGGRITALLPPGEPAPGAVLDAAGCLVLPGAIDAHVHFRAPGLTHKEDWPSGSAAAVAGGVTTVLDMPNVRPATVGAEALAAKAQLVAGRSRCDYGFYGGLAAGQLGALAELAAGGVIGFKVFLGETTAALPPPDDGELLLGLGLAARLGLRTMVHAENGAILQWAARTPPPPEASALRRHGLRRPAVAEVEAVARACLLAREAAAGLCIAHLSTAGGAEAVRRAKADGADVRAEACLHHLLLTEEEAEACGALAQVNPPLRAPADRAALWRAIEDGTVDEVGSDHAPHTAQEKAGPEPPAGFAGVQNLLPHLLGDARLGLRRLVELTAEGPARTWGLWPRKGRLAAGADADLALVRPAAPRGAVRQWSLHPDSPVLRCCQVRAEVVATVVGGQLAYRGGELIGAPAGHWVRP